METNNKAPFEEHFEQLNVAGKIITWMFLIPSGFLYGFVFKTMWLWFIVPLGLPAIGLFHGMGICYVLFFAASSQNATVKDVEGILNYIISKYMYPLIVLANAWIVHYFM